MKSKPKKHNKNKHGMSLSYKLISKVLVALLLLGFLVGAGLVLSTGLLPNKYLFVAVTLWLLLVAGISYGLLKNNLKNKYKTIALVMASLGAIVVSVYIAIVSASTEGFLSSLEPSDTIEIEYSIVAKKGSGVGLDSNNENIAYLKDDPHNDLVLKEVRTRTKANQLAYDNITSMLGALQSKNIDSAVLQSNYLDVIEENNRQVFDDIVVLDKFKVRVPSNRQQKTTDLSRPFIVYISGVDSYDEMNPNSRSDVNILAVINPNQKKILLVNTPRDYYVQLNSTTGTRDKLTHAGLYGPEKSLMTLEDLYAVDIDNYIRINFTSLTRLVDTLGGIDVNSEFDFKSGQYTFNKGTNALDGKAALEFSRNRYSFSDGDRQRGKNQQRVIEAIIEKTTKPDTLIYYRSILSSLTGTFQSNASRNDISTIVKQQLNSAGEWKVESISVDGTGKFAPTYTVGSQPLYVMEPNLESLEAAKSKIQEYLK